MRHDSESRDQRFARLRVNVWAATLLVAITVGAAGCSTESGTAASLSASSTGSAKPMATPSPTTSDVVPTEVESAYLARSVPVRVQIESIGVDSALMDLGLNPDGTMQVPPSGFPAGWYTGAPTPGELGPAIIAGHVDWKGPGVFYNLYKLKRGDRVSITRKDGSKPTFRVTRVQEFPKAQFPTQAVYGNIGNAGLRLITCGGTFNAQSGHYEDNVVVFADLVAPAK